MKSINVAMILFAASFLAPGVAAECVDCLEEQADFPCTSYSIGGTPGVTIYSGTFPGCWGIQYRVFHPVYCPGTPEDVTLCQGTIML